MLYRSQNAGDTQHGVPLVRSHRTERLLLPWQLTWLRAVACVVACTLLVGAFALLG